MNSLGAPALPPPPPGNMQVKVGVGVGFSSAQSSPANVILEVSLLWFLNTKSTKY
jgi:hypothetical protein